ncbi:MAG: hypothetical protein JXR77_00850 [Lentisphaeria bacterium]|nr:hypothetical protein [Lentisphaeria bacterium]
MQYKPTAEAPAVRFRFAYNQMDYNQAVQFYRHDMDWANRLILGHSLQVMSSLARRENLAGKVAAWFLDSDYDGRCFCITQAFFPDQDAWGKIAKALGSQADPEAFAAFQGTVSLPLNDQERNVALGATGDHGPWTMDLAAQ